jgi:hypothetical protein
MQPPSTHSPFIAVNDQRLNSVMRSDPTRCASIAEYARAIGVSIDRIIELLSEYLDDGTLALEIVQGEIFLHTAPNGRPRGLSIARVAPNLWEYLRDGVTPEEAYESWTLLRALQQAGWRVEVRPSHVTATLGPLARRPKMSIAIGANLIPLLGYPATDDIADPAGILDDYERARARAVAVTTTPDGLEHMVTAVRKHFLDRRPSITTSVLILEAPTFGPTLIGGSDTAVNARSVSRTSLEDLEL